MVWFPQQLALVLGVPQAQIIDWVDKRLLPATRKKKTISINEDDLVAFLHEHPENVGRVYCDDIPSFLDECRKNIVEKLEDLNYG